MAGTVSDLLDSPDLLPHEKEAVIERMLTTQIQGKDLADSGLTPEERQAGGSPAGDALRFSLTPPLSVSLLHS